MSLVINAIVGAAMLCWITFCQKRGLSGSHVCAGLFPALVPSMIFAVIEPGSMGGLEIVVPTFAAAGFGGYHLLRLLKAANAPVTRELGNSPNRSDER